MSEEHLKGLNQRQKEAVLHREGPILIIAGAGAGKTKTITHRIINLILNGVEPEKILAVTFTNKAAKEMRERVERELKKSFGGQADGYTPVNWNKTPFISTFHSLGVKIIRENAEKIGRNSRFSILDESDALKIVKEIIKDIGLDPKNIDSKKILNTISREKNKLKKIEKYEEEADNQIKKTTATVWKIYEERKKKENCLDFDDLLEKTVEILQVEEVRDHYQKKWEYIHIDEYQDTNESQYLISKILSGVKKNICAVGDADQNIYSWRGANLKNILNFEKDYLGTKIILLEENYRSTKNILEAANEIIKKNIYRPDKNLFTENREGEKISFYEAIDEQDEANFVAGKILEIIDGWKTKNTKNEQANFPSIAVLYRANFQSRIIEEAMIKNAVPYSVLGIRFFDRKEIKDTLAYLRASINKDSLSDIKRIINFPTRGIGKATLAKIFSGEKESLPIKTFLKIENFYSLLEEIKQKIETEKASEAVKFTIKKTGIESEFLENGAEGAEKMENIKELATLALKYDELPAPKGIEKFLEDASLSSDQDDLLVSEEKEEKENIKSAKLMTVHASKGLEFDYVFITGLEDGLFPHERNWGDSNSSAEDAEEERRLFYVALTRAKKKVFLSFANFRTIFGSKQINAPSEFVGDIPSDVLEKEEERGVKTIYI